MTTQSNGQLVTRTVEAATPAEAERIVFNDPQQPAGQIKSIEVKQ